MNLSNRRYSPGTWWFLISIGLLIVISCEKESAVPATQHAAGDVVIADVGNLGDGRDLQVAFKKAIDEQSVSEYRIVVVKTASASNLDVTAAHSLSSERYVPVPPAGTNYVVSLAEGSKDSDGDVILEGQPYVAFIESVGKDGNNILSVKSNEVTLTLPPTPAVGAIVISDVSNHGDGRDIQISFNKVSDETLIQEYRVVAIKSTVAAGFNLASAEALAPERYTVLAADGFNKNFTLNQASLDSDGDMIAQNGTYNVAVWTLGGGRRAGENNLSAKSNTLMIEIPAAPIATGVVALDVANNANSKDIEISFTRAANEGLISDYRVIVAKTASAGGLSLAIAETLPAARYMVVPKTGENIRVELSPGLQDSDGDVITEATAYSVLVLSMADGVIAGINSLSDPSASLSLLQKNAMRTFATFATGTGGLSVDAAGNVYYGDFGTTDSGGGSQVFKITPSGVVTTFATGLSTADGSDFDSNGNLIQVSYTANQVIKIAPNGSKTVLAGGSPILGPIGVVVDASNNVFVACYNNNTVVKITSSGDATTFATSTSFNGPNGIDIGPTGEIYMCNWSDGLIFRINKDNGSVTSLTNLPIPQKAHLAVYSDKIYVAGRWNHVIYKVNLDGSNSVLVGTSGQRGDRNGELSQTRISWPNDVAFTADGKKMYICMVGLASGSQNILAPSVIKEVSLVE